MHSQCYDRSREIRREMRELGLSRRRWPLGGALVASIAVAILAATILSLIHS